MDEAFDPYRKWLGIPPEEQPPHHYRLLGLELFEEDADVIVNAADARLSFLKTLAGDKHGEMAERIAAQIKEVQACLLDPAKKAFYDGQLQRRIAALKKKTSATAPTPNDAASLSAVVPGKAAAVPAPPPTRQPSAAVGTKNPQFTPSAEFAIPELHIPVYSPLSARSPRKRWNRLAAMIFGLVAVGCLLAFLLVNFKTVDETTPATAVTRAGSGGDKSHGVKSASFASQGNSTASKSAGKPAIPAGYAEKKTPLDRGANAFGDGSSKNSLEVKPAPIIDNPMPPKNSDRKATTSAEHDILVDVIGGNEDAPVLRPSAGRRQPIPGETARQAAEKTVREIYGIKIAAAKSGTEKNALSDRIWNLAVDTKDDSAGQYALMSIACRLAGDSGRLRPALNRTDSFATYFEVDPWKLKAEAVADAVKAAQAAHNNALKIDGDEIVLGSLHFADEAKQAGQFEVALKAVRAAVPLANKDPMLQREMKTFLGELARLKSRTQPVRKASDAFKDKPDEWENVALKEKHHTSVFAMGLKANQLSIANVDKLFDADSRNPTREGEAAGSPLPCIWTITFDQVYQLREIRFHFYDGDARYYHYEMWVLEDGATIWKRLIDPAIGLTYKWQIIPLSGRPVKSVRLCSNFSNNNKRFSLTEFEAYCIPPKQ